MKHEVALRNVTAGDLPIFFKQQLDERANHIAAFTHPNPQDRDAFDAHWAKVLADEGITIRTILYGGEVAGYVLVHSWLGQPEVSYWLGAEFWGKGIATQALRAFLELVPERPLGAHVAYDNLASLRVLEKCGFVRSGTGRFFSHARGMEIDEVILTLPAAAGQSAEGV